MLKSDRADVSPAMAWTALVTCCLGYYMVVFHRMAPAVIASELRTEFSTSSTTLGLLSSVYFIIYGLMQLPVGYLVDRFSPGRIMGVFMGLAAAGSILFGLAGSFQGALFARALTSLGLAAVYVPATKLFGQVLDRRSFILATGILLSSGNVGSLTAAAPLAALVETAGWRNAFFLMGGITAAVAVAMLILLDRGKFKESAKPRKAAAGKARVTKYEILLSAVLGFGVFLKNGPLFSYQGLWGISYLVEVFGLSRMGASATVMIMSVTAALTGLVAGQACKLAHMSERRFMVLSSFAYALSWLPIAIPFGVFAVSSIRIASVLFGAGSTLMSVMMQATIRDSVEEHARGTVNGFVNGMSVVGGAFFQPVMGYMLDRSVSDGRGLAAGYSDALVLGLSAASVSAALFLAAALIARRNSGAKSFETNVEA
ncbi:MAG TPA: MFS transporter [Bacillota bacterium]|nr:MFS transporter [Bacillota bacterium]HOA15412.1 MFS transporter [Bacillota bacterium]